MIFVHFEVSFHVIFLHLLHILYFKHIGNVLYILSILLLNDFQPLALFHFHDLSSILSSTLNRCIPGLFPGLIDKGIIRIIHLNVVMQ